MEKQPLSVKAIFDRALEIEAAAEREAYLDEAYANAPELRQQVEALLKAYEDAGSFLEKPVPDLGATVDSQPAQPGDEDVPAPPDSKSAGSRFASEEPGRVTGPYKLLQQIGEGGMGTVFMAEQTRPVQRMVALKIIKAGMDSHQVIARFEAERQALALMDHPNIARVLDAGTTESSRHTPCAVASDGTRSVPATSGRPYFVMELVKGVPITRYCDEHHLTPRQRLELFVPVCQAVQHAHQKGIIHRDIKPSNVMVCLYDGKPVPKVIDFGIAKATGPSLTEKTLFTEIGQVVGTLEYMSPEQAELNQLDIDTRSDIYSLGVLLYELLTGTTPLERKRFKEVAFLEVLRLIREEESPKPSTRLSTTEGLASIAANRGLEPKKLSGLVRGELDWIVMKTLEKDRSRRYETANGLAMDVQRYLADEPVQACPPSAGYRLRKFVRRHRGPVLAAALVLLALIGGIIGTTWQAVRATWAEEEAIAQRDEKDEARREAVKERDEKETARAQAATAAEEARKAKDAESAQRKRAEAAKDAESAQRKLAEAARDRAAETLDAMTSSVVGDALTQQQVITPEQKQFLTTALEYYRELLKEKASVEATRKRLAAAAHRLGFIEFRLGREEEGAVMFREARNLYAKLATDFPAVPSYREEHAGSQSNLGVLLQGLGKWDQAETEHRAAIDLCQKLMAEFPAIPAFRRILATSHNNLGIVLGVLGKLDQAETEYRAAVDLRQKLTAEFPADPAYRQGIADSHSSLGNLLADIGKRDQAETEYRAAIDLRKQLAVKFPAVPGYRHELARSHNGLGLLLNSLGKWDQAETEHRAALNMQKKLVAESPAVPDYHQGLAISHHNLGVLLHAAFNKREQADTEYRAALAILKKLAAEFPAVPKYRHALALSHNGAGAMLQALEKWDQAETEYRAALEIYKKLVADFPAMPGYRHELAMTHNNLVHLLHELGKREQAGTECRAARDIYKQLVAEFPADPDYAIGLGGALCNLGNLMRDGGGRPNDALAWYEQAIATLSPVVEKGTKLAVARQFLLNSYGGRAEVLDQLQRYDEAVKDWAGAMNLSPEKKKTFVHCRLMLSRVRAGQFETALKDADQLAKTNSMEVVYDCACVYALAHAQTKDDKQAVRAVELLRQAVAKGYRNVGHLKKDADLDSLRHRDDFRQFIAELEKMMGP